MLLPTTTFVASMDNKPKSLINVGSSIFTNVLDEASGGNPFYEPIESMVKQIRSTPWALPYIHNLVMVIVCIFLILVFFTLYISVGVASQIVAIFGDQIAHERQRIIEVSPVEKSGHAMAIGIYFLVMIPFWLIQVPFLVIAYIADYSINLWKASIQPKLQRNIPKQ